MARSWTPSQEAAMAIRGKTLLVCAAAGSGKTSVLTERIIRSLTDTVSPADLSRMLVVTFTRAAAAELKSRIATALSEAMAKSPDNKHLSRQLFLLGGAQISTIDSFFQKAVRANFEQLGLPPSFRLADENELTSLKCEILEELLEQGYRDFEKDTDLGAGLLHTLDKNRFAHAMDHLLSNRSDGRLIPLLLDFSSCYAADPRGVKALEENATALLQGADVDYLTTPHGACVMEYLSDFFQSALSFLENTRATLEASPDIFVKCDAILSSDIAYCQAMKEALREGGYTRVREVAFSFVSGRFPSLRIRNDALDLYQEWRTRWKADLTKRVQPLFAPTGEELSRQMRETGELLTVLYELFSKWEARLMEEKKARGVFEYDDIRALLYRLLTNPDGTASAFAASLASQYDSVYIDEYQDVDALQDRIFSIIGGNRRFMVGDIKQSIYGFRGSDPSIFAGYRRAMPAHDSKEATGADGVCVFMSENFRCDEPVIRFANRVCSFLFSASEKSIGYRPADDLVFSKSAPALPTPPVRFAVFDAPPRGQKSEEDTETRREEAIWTAAEISRLLREESLDDGRPISPDDIAILVRTRAQGDAFVRELQHLNVPVKADAASDPRQSPLLTDLLNLLRAIDNPYRDLPLSECLLSPLFRFDLEELCEIRTASEDNLPLYDAMRAWGKADALGERITRALTFFEAAQRNAAVLSADHFLRTLYATELLSPLSNHPILLFLYEQARLFQRTAFCGLYGFLKQFCAQLEGGKLSLGGFGKEESAVTVMTVHHSKGLEFPVVFLCATGAYFNHDDAKKTLLYHREVGFASKLYDPISGDTDDTALRAALKLRTDGESLEENVRNLYVALTRARERLYVTGTLGGKWETARTNASLVRRGDRTSILGAGSMLAWLLAAVLETENEDAPVCVLSRHSYGDVEEGLPMHDASRKDTDAAEADLSPTALALSHAAITYRQTDYPLSHLQGLPTKLAASKIAPNLLDVLEDEENDVAALDAQIELMSGTLPAFEAVLRTIDQPGAAQIGTATHAFLQFCDFAALADGSVESECDRLVANGFIDPQMRKLLRMQQLTLFQKSELLRMILAAKQVRREQTFGIYLPLSGMTQRKERAEILQNERIFVQGSIDLLLETETGERVLIDYKTDRISPAEAENETDLIAHMQEKHAHQLAAYSTAVTQLFGAPPDRIYIYSLPLGKLIPISVS